jgi:hypothetical protein
MDWYICENMCATILIDKYKLTRTQLNDVCSGILRQWINSRISIGECVGLTSTTSCYVDQTQNVLDSKHGIIVVLQALTALSARWNSCVSQKTSNVIDNLITAFIRTNFDPVEAEQIRIQTGCQVLDDGNVNFFKECTLNKVIRATTLEAATHMLPDTTRLDISATFDRIETSIFGGEKGQVYKISENDDSENNTPKQWYRSPHYTRMIIDIRYCREMKTDWKHLLRLWLQYLSCKFAVTARAYRYSFNDNDITPVCDNPNTIVLHIFKVIALSPESGTDTKKISQTAIWGKENLKLKHESKAMESIDSTLFIFENELLCMQQYFYSVFVRLYQENKVKAVIVENEVVTSVDQSFTEEDYDEVCDVGIDNNGLITELEDRHYTATDMTTTSTTATTSDIQTLKKVSMNIQSKDALKYIYQFILRPDVMQDSVSLINLDHTCTLYGILAARNQMVVELRKVLDDIKSPVNRHHIELICDFSSYKGILLPLKPGGMKYMNTDWVTSSSTVNNSSELISSARYSKESNPQSLSLCRLISKQMIIGEGMFESDNNINNNNNNNN